MACKRRYEKRILIEARQDPLRLGQIRKKRREAGRRWLNKMKSETPDKYAEYVRAQSAKEKSRKESNPQRRIACMLRTKVYIAIRRQQSGFKSANTIELSGCSIEDFMKHLETTWQPGMNWENLGRGEGKWAMDHIRPCASFDLTIPEQQKLAFHFSNVRAMWFVENCSKGSEHEGRRWHHADHACQPDQPA